MPDTRRDLFSLSTRIDPLAATVRENINSIRVSASASASASFVIATLRVPFRRHSPPYVTFRLRETQFARRPARKMQHAKGQANQNVSRCARARGLDNFSSSAETSEAERAGAAGCGRRIV